jgi:polyhydroxyalkanoate synthesis regulator phasin
MPPSRVSQYPRRTVPDKDPDSKNGVWDALRKYVDAAVSVTDVPRERAEKVFRELAERGEVRARDLQKVAQEMADRSARNREELARLIRKEIKRQISSLGLATRNDVERLSTRVRKLEGSSGTKSTAKKKPAKPRAQGPKKS